MARLSVIGWGNPSRRDDALGLAAIDWLADALVDAPARAITLQKADQLSIEHVLDLAAAQLVLFIDADQSCRPPCRLQVVVPSERCGYTTHSMSPNDVLRAFQIAYHRQPPPAFLLSIRGEDFDLGEGLSQPAARDLSAATALLARLVDAPDVTVWLSHTAED